MNYVKLTFLLVLFPLCNRPAAAGDAPTGDPLSFDRKAMLENYADNLIVPAYKTLQADVNDLQAKAEVLIKEPSIPNIIAAQEAWTKTHLSFQKANAFNFGPAGKSGDDVRLAREVGTFPVSVLKMEQRITKGLPVLDDTDLDARGLLAVEYLIFAPDGNNEHILDMMFIASRQVYLRKQIANLKEDVDAVVAGWDSYRNAFVADEGTGAGSSIALLYNEFVRSYEVLKDLKVGRPLGTQKGQSEAEPERAEGYYSGKSALFIKAHFEALEDIWLGRGASGDGPGFREYLLALNGGNGLVQSTEAQIANIKRALAALEGPASLTQKIKNNKPQVGALHNELKKNARFFKEDMSQVLGIAIDSSEGG